MARLLDYLNHLDQNADAVSAHKQDPQKAMTDFGLSADEQQAMLSGDKEQVANLIGINSDDLPVVEIPQF